MDDEYGNPSRRPHDSRLLTVESPRSASGQVVMKPLRRIHRRLSRWSLILIPAISLLERMIQRRLLEPLLTRALRKRVSGQSSRYALRHLWPQTMSEPVARSVDRYSLRLSGSFRAELSRRTIVKNYSTVLPEWRLNDKAVGRAFANRCGVRVPVVHASGVRFDDIDLSTPVIVKPLYGAGSKGVFLYRSDDEILDIQNRQTFSSLNEFRGAIAALLTSGKISADEWIVEEYIAPKSGTIPSDLKFYTFYGRVGLIQEINRDEADTRYCFWSRSGRVLETGKFRNRRGFTSFLGDGATTSEISIAEELSTKIPAPSVRIDFLKGESSLCFGEFTPRPGAYHTFHDPIDRKLGQLFIDAEARLYFDLVHGKRFSEFNDVVHAREPPPTAR